MPKRTASKRKRTYRNLEAERRYEASGRRPARHYIKLTLDDDQLDQLEAKMLKSEKYASAIKRIVGIY